MTNLVFIKYRLSLKIQLLKHQINLYENDLNTLFLYFPMVELNSKMFNLMFKRMNMECNNEYRIFAKQFSEYCLTFLMKQHIDNISTHFYETYPFYI